MAATVERLVAEAADLALHAADVGDDAAGRQGGGDLRHQRSDLVDRGADDHQLGRPRGVRRGVGHRIAPRLTLQLQPGLGPAGPEGQVPCGAIVSHGPGHGGAEQAGSEDGDAVEHVPQGKAAGPGLSSLPRSPPAVR